jgi:hypothetical protein
MGAVAVARIYHSPLLMAGPNGCRGSGGVQNAPLLLAGPNRCRGTVVVFTMHHSRWRVPMGAAAVVVFTMHHYSRRVPMGAAAVAGMCHSPLQMAGPNGCRGSGGVQQIAHTVKA